jgi:hypothetical protein
MTGGGRFVDTKKRSRNGCTQPPVKMKRSGGVCPTRLAEPQIIHQLWTVGAPLPATIIINRAMKQQALVPS